MLAEHLQTLLALRSDVWEDVTTQSAAQRGIQDTFPLTGSLAEFDWGVGDGLRRNFPSIGIVDETPVQLIQVQRTLQPDGASPVQASFRPRVRNQYETLRRFIKAVLTDRRAFQGQLVYPPSTMGSSSTGATTFAQAPLPRDLSLVQKAELVVVSKSNTTTQWTIEVNGVNTGITLTHTGPVDISSYIGRNNTSEPQLLVRLTSPTPSTGSPTASYVLRLTELIPKA
jgi:hypothetical protein